MPQTLIAPDRVNPSLVAPMVPGLALPGRLPDYEHQDVAVIHEELSIVVASIAGQQTLRGEDAPQQHRPKTYEAELGEAVLSVTYKPDADPALYNLWPNIGWRFSPRSSSRVVERKITIETSETEENDGQYIACVSQEWWASIAGSAGKEIHDKSLLMDYEGVDILSAFRVSKEAAKQFELERARTYSLGTPRAFPQVDGAFKGSKRAAGIIIELAKLTKEQGIRFKKV